MAVAVVTGGSRGIGAAIVRRLAADGMAVVIGYHTDDAAAERVRAAVAQAGGTAIAVRADLADESHIASLIEQSVARFGRLDLLVNNAAIAEVRALADMDATHIDASLALNVRGVLLASKHAVARMERGGCIVNISSDNARNPVPTAAVYSATKAAVEALTKALARELGPRGIRVNAVAPGWILTERHAAEIPPDTQSYVVEHTALGRLGTPADIAAVVAFLASPDAAWITGEIVGATGGYGA